jgi:hypothetical protein
VYAFVFSVSNTKYHIVLFSVRDVCGGPYVVTLIMGHPWLGGIGMAKFVVENGYHW